MKQTVTKKASRCLAMLLAMLMLLSAFSMTAFAAGRDELTLWVSEESEGVVGLEITALHDGMYEGPYPGTFVITCNGERILEDQEIKESHTESDIQRNIYLWTLPAKGNYTFQAKYVPAESEDSYDFKPSKPIAIPYGTNAADSSEIMFDVIEQAEGTYEFQLYAFFNNVFDGPFPGDFIIKCNGERILADQKIKLGDYYEWIPATSGDYTFTAEYIPAQADPYSFYPVEGTLHSYKYYYALTVENGAGSGNFYRGEKVTVTADPAPKSNYVFKGWEVIAGQIGSEVDLTQNELTFQMPDNDLTLTATYDFSIQLFFKNLAEKVFPIFQTIIDFFSGLFS